MSVILSSVISSTGGMVMSFSSAVFDTLVTNVFNMLFLCDANLQTSVTRQHEYIVVAEGFAVLAFLNLHHSLLMGSFVSKFCSRS